MHGSFQEVRENRAPGYIPDRGKEEDPYLWTDKLRSPADRPAAEAKVLC